MRTVVVCLCLLVATARAERLPVRVFTTADGLANNRVNRGTLDANGFLWLATGEGVSRFDGGRFESFGIADGLPNANTNDVLGTRDGRLYVATDGGVAMLDLAERSLRPTFRTITPEPADCVIQDADGVVWSGGPKGLVRYDGVHTTSIKIPHGVISIAYDPHDRSMWIGTYRGLVHRTRDGALTHWQITPPAPASNFDDRVMRVFIARDGKLWISHIGPLVLVVTLPLPPTAQPLSQVTTITQLVPHGAARRDILQDSTGTIWVGTNHHLDRWNGHALEMVTSAQLGIEAGAPTPSIEDSAGNLWFGTDAQGVVRLARDGIVSYDTTDGLDSLNAYGFVEEPDGPLHVVTLGDGGHTIAQFADGRFTSAHPNTVYGAAMAWGVGQIATIDHDHRWWYPTAYGVLRFPRVASAMELATAQPKLYTDLPGRDVQRLYLDSRGDVWLSTMSQIGLARWDHTTDRMITLSEGWPTALAAAFDEDAQGDVWIGYADGHIVRVHDGQPHTFPITVAGTILALAIDHAGRLWVASEEQGVMRVDDPQVPHPRYYRAAELGSDQATALVEEGNKIYVGTTRGITRIDPSSDEIVHYGADEGLRNDYIVVAFRSRDHSLWFGSKGGAAHLVPREAPTLPTTPLFITHLSRAGQPVALAAGGQRAIDSIELASDEGALDLELASPRFAIGERLRFQYRLDEGWSSPIMDRSLHFARLAAGRYNLEVRAIDARGSVSPSATIAFTVMPPLWRRWWAITGAIVVISLLGYLAYRRRLAHVLAIERVRTRIATDLHDELGSSLSRISILSEVASRRAAAREDIGSQITVIGTSARELVDVASDIVWSTDPRRDDLGSLLVRLRTFAADLFDARGIAWSIIAPSEPTSIKLSPDRRRHLYLVLKEAITNSARHSNATRVEVTIALAARGLTASVRDDGDGFDEATLLRPGNGLTNMRARAVEAGGTLAVRCDGGTEVTLRLT